MAVEGKKKSHATAVGASANPLWMERRQTLVQKHGAQTHTHTHLLSSVTWCHCALCGLLVVCRGMPNTTTNGLDTPPGDIKLSTLVPVLSMPLSSLKTLLPENTFFFLVRLQCFCLTASNSPLFAFLIILFSISTFSITVCVELHHYVRC